MHELKSELINKKILDLQHQLYYAERNRDYDYALQLDQAINHLKSELANLVRQQTDFITSWFSTNDPNLRFALGLEHGIFEVLPKTSGYERFRSRSKVHKIDNSGREKRYWVYWRDNSQCMYCQVHLDRNNSHVDHIIPQSAWPTEWTWLANDTSNLVASCSYCNQVKNNKLQLPNVMVENLRIQVCMPKRNDDFEFCALYKPCEICIGNGYTAEIICVVHGRQTVSVCEITGVNEYLRHE